MARTTRGKGVATSGWSGGGRSGASALRFTPPGAKICTSRKLLIVDGERKALLNDARSEWDGVGLNMAVRRGEKTGSLRLPNLSTRPPSEKRNLSKKISSWK